MCAQVASGPPNSQLCVPQGALLATINIGVVLMPLTEILRWKRHELHDAAKSTYARAKRSSSRLSSLLSRRDIPSAEV